MAALNDLLVSYFTANGAPPSANILSGSVQGTSTATTTIITIPVGRTWVGSISAAMACASANGLSTLSVNTAGSGVTPTTGTLGQALGYASAGSPNTNIGYLNLSPVVVSASTSGAVTIQSVSVGTSFFGYSASAIGVLI